jgi:hypothetical protein
MAKRFETTPRGFERTEMSGLLSVRRAPLAVEASRQWLFEPRPLLFARELLLIGGMPIVLMVFHFHPGIFENA